MLRPPMMWKPNSRKPIWMDGFEPRFYEHEPTAEELRLAYGDGIPF
jgi:hypothetical protein